jgi:hypothetical protein
VANIGLWTYRESGWADVDLVGFEVEALDGEIGTIDDASNEVGSSYVVIDTGPWIFGRRVVLPAGLIERLDINDRRVFVRLAKDEIKNAPEFDESTYRDTAYRDQVGSYYARGGFAGDPDETPPTGWPGAGRSGRG